MSNSTYSKSGFSNLSSRDRVSYLYQLLSSCTHEELLSIQAVLSQFFYRQFITELPRQLALKILLKLSLRDLFSCMLVSRTWYDVIHSEPCIWKEQVKSFHPYYKPSVESYQLKLLCRQTRLFQLRMFDTNAYKIETFSNRTSEIENINVFEIHTSSNYLVIHGLSKCDNGLYRDLVTVWKWMGTEFEYKKNILEEIDVGSYITPLATKSGSRIQMFVNSNFVSVVHSVYLDIFDLNSLSFTSRVPLPSMSGVMSLDYTINPDNSPNITGLAFFDKSLYFIKTSNGDTLNSITVDMDPFDFYFLENPDLKMLLYSSFEIRLFNISEDFALTVIPDFLPREANDSKLSLKLSNNKHFVAILQYNSVSALTSSKLFLFSTNPWNLIRSVNLWDSYTTYTVLAVGRKYTVLMSLRAKLELTICDLQRNEPLIRSVLFQGISPYPEIFCPEYVVVMLTNGWLDGDIFDNILSVEKKDNNIPMFLVLRIPFQLSILYLNLN